ncbi:hypothetical protein BC832DRAFT_403485 [Gaertneriomyces semiglobifer]|nr:hypothetical protein BC832DRAFT_403485 [Gaertneriomyces semiglobifer]
MFRKYILPVDSAYEKLQHANLFEDFPVGRKGAILIQPSAAGGSIPIVRTTTCYKTPSQPFSAVHHDIIEQVSKVANVPSVLYWNNAMVEIYTPEYTKMKFHSDAAIDLAPDSYIGIFSCYENATEPNPRMLIVKEKETGKTFSVTLDNNSVVLFSTSANQKYLHKICCVGTKTQSRWLGLTMRQSTTYIRNSSEGVAHLLAGTGADATEKVLRFADEEERREFYKCKSLENATVGFVYPQIDYTLSMH